MSASSHYLPGIEYLQRGLVDLPACDDHTLGRHANRIDRHPNAAPDNVIVGPYPAAPGVLANNIGHDKFRAPCEIRSKISFHGFPRSRNARPDHATTAPIRTYNSEISRNFRFRSALQPERVRKNTVSLAHVPQDHCEHHHKSNQGNQVAHG